MLSPQSFTFTGISGDTYAFEVYSKSAELPDGGGVYVLTYSHPRGHVAGFQVNPLCMGAAESLRSAVAGLSRRTCLQEQCWNYTAVLRLDAPHQRAACLEDVRGNNPTRC